MNSLTKLTISLLSLFMLSGCGATQDQTTTSNTNTSSYNPKDCRYDVPTYVWSEDNKTCTATAKCLVHEDEVVTETATATHNYYAPTCNSEGHELFDVYFKRSEIFKEQHKELIIPATGEHAWSEPVYDWEDWGVNFICHAYRYCTVCGTQEREDVTPTFKIIKEATFEEPCIYKYTASFENEAFATQEKEVESYTLSDFFKVIEKRNDDDELIGYCITNKNELIGPERVTSIVFPNEYNNLPILKVGLSLYSFRKLEKIDFGDNVKELSLSYCTSLTSIEAPNTVENLSLSYCDKLESVSIGENITNLEIHECHLFNTITVSDNNPVFKAENNLLLSKDGATLLLCPQGIKGEVNIPQGVNTIGANAFMDCTSITGITIPDSVSKIGGNAFKGCTSLRRLDLPDNVSNVDSSFISYCSNLETLSLGASFDFNVESDYNFPSFAIDCDKLRYIFVSDNNLKYKSINDVIYSVDGKTVLFAAKALGSITPISSVDKLGLGCFSGCHATRIDLSNTKITTIPEGTTYRLSELTSISFPTTLINIGNNAFNNATSLVDFTVPDTVGSIGEHFLNDCTSLKNLYIGKGVISMSMDSLFNTPKLENINVSEDNNVFKSVDGVLFNKEGYTLYRCPANYGSGSTEYNVPNTVVRINDNAFFGCKSLQTITIPQSVTIIKGYVFGDCNDLINVSYAGTVNEFEAITKDEDWYFGLNVEVIHCLDGDYQLTDNSQSLD